MRNYQSNLDSSVPLELDGPGPLYERLARALREAIRCSRLPDGSLLPPSRILAADLGCSRWVVTQAYAQLATAGYVESRTGSGTRVRALATAPARPRDLPPASARANSRIDMAPGLPGLRAFPAARWAAAVRSAAAGLSVADLGYPDPAGHQALREVLAEYLTRARGAQAEPGNLTICASATDGIGRIGRALRRAGCRTVGVEDPGWHRAREVVGAAGLAIRPIPVDDHGMRAELPGDVGAVIVTPAHQFPAGVVLSAQRRAALIDWARRTGGLVIEDDYDAEYRYDHRPVTAVQGTGPSHVVLLGSVSKILSPALRIGWVVSPPAWTSALREPPAAPPPVLDQLAFAEFLRSGSYDRHLRAGRKRYRARRDNLDAALTASIPEATVSGAAAGLHLLLGLGTGADSEAVRDHALKLGVRVANLDRYRCGEQSWPGLVLSYGNMADHQVDEGVALLAAAIRRLPRLRLTPKVLRREDAGPRGMCPRSGDRGVFPFLDHGDLLLLLGPAAQEQCGCDRAEQGDDPDDQETGRVPAAQGGDRVRGGLAYRHRRRHRVHRDRPRALRRRPEG
ncbi:MAG: PLP-dependent aminotransferase family protein [Trebonia sp.]